MKTNKSLLILGIGLILILSLSFAITAKNNHSQNGEPKMTYGKCVANLTKEKNTCYRSAQQNYKDCQSDLRDLIRDMRENNQTINNTQIIESRKNCLLTEKSELQVCKNGFKNEKEFCTQFKSK
jgi:hypothetical protein